MTEQEIYIEAMNRQDPAERRRFLDKACGGDSVLRDRLEKLIGHSEQVGSFLLHPPQPLSATAEMTSVAESPGSQIGPYKIREQIGEGGMGVVYVAEQTEPVRRRVALKIIKPGMDTKDVIVRFEAERQALAMMDHPHIAKVLDAGSTESGRPYFVMELVRGIPITEYREQKMLSTRSCLDLLIKVCHAIQHAHQKGIIHRDIKPSNILVTLHDGVPVPKVIDFGVAKAIQRELTEKTIYTQFQQFIGTPAYMSPEQAEMSGLDIDTRSDIYSLGVLAYQLLTGVTPFDAHELIRSGLDGMRRIIREREPLRPSSRLTQELETAKNSDPTNTTLLGTQRVIRSAVDRDLDWIVMKCLEKDRTRRYATASDLAADLNRYLEDEPIVARPPSAVYRFQKAFRRNRLVFVTVALITLSLVAGIGVSTWQALVARKAQKTAQDERVRADAEARSASESDQRARRLLYASDINLAQQALTLNNLGKARRLLDRHRPQPGEEDLRGWEWRYLWQLARGNTLQLLTTRTIPGGSVSFSPDGTRLAVGWIDGRVDLWDVPGRRLDRTLTHLRSVGGRVAFSPVGNLLAATSKPDEVTLYDLGSDQQSILWRPPTEASWQVNGFDFSKDGSMVVVHATVNKIGDVGVGEVFVVDLSPSDTESRHVTVGEAACLSPNNRRLYVIRLDLSEGRPRPGQGSSLYGYIQCIELRTGEELWRTKTLRAIGLASLDISPDGRLLASGSAHEDPTIRVWDAETGRLVRSLDGHSGWVSAVFTPNGRRLLSSSADQTIRLWDTGTWTRTQLLRGHTAAVRGVTVSEPKQLIASVGNDGNLMLWNEDGPDENGGYVRLPADGLYDVRWLNMNDSRVLLVPPDKTPELVDLKGDSPSVLLPRIEPFDRFQGWPQSWASSDIVCHWNGDKQILVYKLRGGTLVPRGAIALHSAARPKLIYSDKRQLLAWAEEAFPMSVFVASLAVPGRRVELKSDVPNILPWRFSEDGRFLAGPNEGQNAARAWNVETGEIVVTIDEKGWDLDFAAGGRILVASLEHGRDHEVVFFDLVNPDQPARRVPGPDHSRMLAISPDGRTVACATLGGEVRLYDPVKGELVASFHGHMTQAYGVAFSPDGKRLISTASGLEAVKLWDVGTRQELLTLRGDGSYLYMARWLAGGDVILAGAPWQAWHAPSWEQIASAEKAEVTP